MKYVLLLTSLLLTNATLAFDIKDFQNKRFSCMDTTGKINHYLDIKFMQDSTYTLQFREDATLTRGLRGDVKISGDELRLRGRPYYETSDKKEQSKADEMNDRLKNALYKESYFKIISFNKDSGSLEIDEIDLEKKKPSIYRFCTKKE